MAIETIDDPVTFIRNSGGLHDTRVQSLDFSIENETFIMVTDDLNANFADLPEYPGQRPCKIVLRQVSKLLLDLETFDGLWISAATVTKLPGDVLLVEIDTNSGAKSIRAEFKALEIHDV